MRTVLFALVLAGCWTSKSAPPKDPDDERRVDTTHYDDWGDRERDPIVVSSIRPPDPVAPPGTFMVAGCNTACNGCAIGHSTDVHGVDVSTGKELFPKPAPGGVGYSCAEYMPIGSHVRLVAKSGDGLVLEKWRAFNADDYCPCAGTASPVCDVTVTKEVAAKYTRAYCGADWKSQGPAQIGH